MGKQIRQQSLRVLALLLTLAMVVSVVPAVHGSEEVKTTADGFVYRLAENDKGKPCVEITDYTGDASELTIPSQIQGLPVDTLSSYAFADCTSLTHVTISEGIRVLHWNAFSGCTALTQVDLPESLESILPDAFSGCSSLTGIDIPERVTLITNGSFYGCSSLTSFQIHKNITYVDRNAFTYCTSLKSFSVDEANTSFCSRDGVLYSKDQSVLVRVPCAMEGSFTIPDGVTTIYDCAVHGCEKITSVHIPDSVNKIGYAAFNHCRGLTSIEIPEGVTLIEDSTFGYCDALSEVQLPWTLKTIGWTAFRSCPNLTSIQIPSSVTRIDPYAFEDCTGLSSVTFLGNAPEIGEGAFQNVTAVCKYSRGYAGWTPNVFRDYEGTLIWAHDDQIHVHEFTVSITPPTCLEWGYSTYTCDCGYGYVDDHTFFHGHSMGAWEVYRQPTCTQRGEERSSCTDCGYYESRQMEMTEHSFSDGICQNCGCDAESAMRIVDVTQYQYTVTPIIAPFAYYLYVQTDNPDPRSFRLVDRESAYYDDGDMGKIRIPTDFGYSSIETEPGTYYIAQSLYPDVVYEDQGIYRVPGGYIFLAHVAYSDGGEFHLLQQTVAGEDLLDDRFRDTDVVIPCQKLYTRLPYLLEQCTSPEQDLFENLDQLNAYLEDYAVYPRSVFNADKPDGDRRYPFLASAYWQELDLDERYTIFEQLEDGLLMMEAYPFVLDSLSYPGAIAAAAEQLAPGCVVDTTDLHYEVRITHNGESRIYGGAGSGGKDPLYSNRVEKVFTFSGGTDCATSGTLESHCQTLLAFSDVVSEDNARYMDLVSGETFRNTIKRSGSTWIQVATEGFFGYGTSFAYLMWDGDSVQEMSDAWVDGRYIGMREIIELGATFEDHPTANILLHDVTYTDAWGVVQTGDVLYRFDETQNVWTSMDAYNPAWDATEVVLPEELVLTQEEVAALDLDAKSFHWPDKGLIYDGTAQPGTPFAYTPVTGVALTEAVTLYEGEEATLEVQIFPADADDPRVEWTVADEAIATIVDSEQGLIRGLAEGTTYITVTTIDGGYCAVCQVTVKDSCENGHSFTNYVSDNNATCTEDGTKTAVCDRCDATSTHPDEGSARGHLLYDVTVIQKATCTEDGLESGICWRCEQMCEQVVPATGHIVWTIPGQSPTCTSAGTTDHTVCMVCDTVLAEQTEIPALGHDLGEWYVTREATCRSGGMEQRDCSRCQYTETREIPAADHDYEVVETPPTCTEKGTRLKVCRTCGSEVTEYIPATGHTPVTDPAEEPDCSRSGLTEGSHCKNCLLVLVAQETVEPLGHDWDGSTCSRCGAVRKYNPFTDVAEEEWYAEPVLWAVEQGITAGTSETTFSPDQICTRAQVVTFLWRAMGKPAPESDENPFSDVKPGDYFYDAVLWAVENGITSGTGNGKFSPDDFCTRGQVVTFLWRAMGKATPESAENPFADVKETDYFFEPVLWAVENKITAGTGAGKFSPEDSCTRGQVVTFLYRAMAEQ